MIQPPNRPGDDRSPARARALVAFVGRTRLRWLGWLRPGFRHCFVVLEAEEGCIVCDPLADRTLIGSIAGASLVAVQRYCWQHGYTALEVGIEGHASGASLLRPFTCVEFVKRVLCLWAPRVHTPWQLFCLLRARRSSGAIRA